MGDAALLAALGRARDRGFLGPGDPARHLDHARGFVEVAGTALGGPARRVADLGSGGGVPGLVLAASWSEAEVVLVESSVRRAEALRAEVHELGLGRVEILEGRAEELAHDPAYRGRFDLVTARSFGPPPVTAEIGAGFTAVDGVLVVSEPPAPTERWPAEPLHRLGFDPPAFGEAAGAHFVCLRKRWVTPPDRPRRRGRPAKRPLW